MACLCFSGQQVEFGINQAMQSVLAFASKKLALNNVSMKALTVIVRSPSDYIAIGFNGFKPSTHWPSFTFQIMSL